MNIFHVLVILKFGRHEKLTDSGQYCNVIHLRSQFSLICNYLHKPMMDYFYHQKPNVLDVLNTAKVITGTMVLFSAGRFGLTPRATIYVSLHASYLVWWFIEQYFFPPFWNRFSAEVHSLEECLSILCIVGLLYSFPAYNVICRSDRKQDISPSMTIVCVMMFTMGSLINTMSDVHMHATKEAMAPQKVLITNGLYRLCQNPNYFGDYLRYTSFCLSSGKASSFVVLGVVFLLNFVSTLDAAQKGGMREKYGVAYDEWTKEVPNFVVPSLNESYVVEIALVISAVWIASYLLGLSSRSKSMKKGKIL
jgi:protein-S-isoprenylcysteine O-methyltransferase Ste14